MVLSKERESTLDAPYPKLKFINRFYLYTGMSKYFEDNELFWKSMDQFEK